MASKFIMCTQAKMLVLKLKTTSNESKLNYQLI
jgi:hypothetical protein